MVGNSRYYKYNFLAYNFLISKESVQWGNNNFPLLKSICLEAGHYRLNSFFQEYGLILASLSPTCLAASVVSHGKRQKKTIFIRSIVSDKRKLFFIMDKFINVVIPSFEDLVIKVRKRSVFYEWRFQKYFEWEEISALISNRLLGKTSFFPFALSAHFCNKGGHLINSYNTYMRMMRFPFSKI